MLNPFNQTTKGVYFMSLAAHISALESKHNHLEYLIGEESNRPLPDFTVIQTLKKQKLILKEELERISPMPRRSSGDVG